VIVEAQIQNIIREAQKSPKFKELIERRHGNRSSALNDTVAYFYVKSRRGKNITEFADVKCWFLHNSYKTDYESNMGYKIHERNAINANELLTLLWLTSPNQLNIDSDIISKGGLTNYVAKYRILKMPSTELIKQINEKVKTALKYGKVYEKDIYSIGIRMSEGHLSTYEAEELIRMPDDQFIDAVKEFSKQDEDIRHHFSKQNDEIEEFKTIVKNLASDNQRLKEDNAQIKFDFAMGEYAKKQSEFIDLQIISKRQKFNTFSISYIFFVLIVSAIWFVDKTYSKLLNSTLSLFISLILMLTALVFIKFVDHKTILHCFKYTFSKRFKESVKIELKQKFMAEYESQNIKPKFSDFKME